MEINLKDKKEEEALQQMMELIIKAEKFEYNKI